MDNKLITVRNAEGEPNTEAQIIIQNKIKYTPKVSIVVPVYNVEPYLEECLNSIIKQTLKEIEIICVDDGSTDNSLKILQEYAKKDKRFTIITQKNLYAGVARNAGLSVAKGEYLSFLDSDDFFEPKMLEKMYKKAIKEKADICVCEFDIFIDGKCVSNMHRGINKKYINGNSTFKPDDIKYLYSFTNPAAWNKLYQHDLLKMYNLRFQNLFSCNDIEFTFSALSMSSKITVVPEILLHYRQSDTSITSKRGAKAINILYVYKYLYNYLNKKGKSHLIEALDYQMKGSFMYELSKCTNAEKMDFKKKSKKILGKLFSKYSDILYTKKVKIFSLLGFIPLLSIEEE